MSFKKSMADTPLDSSDALRVPTPPFDPSKRIFPKLSEEELEDLYKWAGENKDRLNGEGAWTYGDPSRRAWYSEPIQCHIEAYIEESLGLMRGGGQAKMDVLVYLWNNPGVILRGPGDPPCTGGDPGTTAWVLGWILRNHEVFNEAIPTDAQILAWARRHTTSQDGDERF